MIEILVLKRLRVRATVRPFVEKRFQNHSISKIVVCFGCDRDVSKRLINN